MPASAATADAQRPAGLDAATQALCFFYRNPPPSSGVKPQPYKAIPELIGRPDTRIGAIKMAVRRFGKEKKPRGRRSGWRKTTKAEDACIIRCFKKVRQPLGALVEAPDVWRALPHDLRAKASIRTVSNRLAEHGFSMQEKASGDDLGVQWRKTRVRFCKRHAQKTPEHWVRNVQGVADFRFFVFYPESMKDRYARKSAPRTIMHKTERAQPEFMKPRKKIFKRSEYKRVRKAKVFGLTTSTGAKLVAHVPARLTARSWIRFVHKRLGPFMQDTFPRRRRCTILLDGETLMHTDDARAAMRSWGLRALPHWPAHSPDLNPQENVWGWAKPQVRKEEAKADTFETFKKRVTAVCGRYPGAENLVPSLAHRMELCLSRGGGPIGK